MFLVSTGKSLMLQTFGIECIECEKVLLYPLNFCSSVDKYAQACLGDQKNLALGTLSGKQGMGIDIISNYCYI